MRLARQQKRGVRFTAENKSGRRLSLAVVRFARPTSYLRAHLLSPLFHLYTLAPLYLRRESGCSRKSLLLDLGRRESAVGRLARLHKRSKGGQTGGMHINLLRLIASVSMLIASLSIAWIALTLSGVVVSGKPIHITIDGGSSELKSGVDR